MIPSLIVALACAGADYTSENTADTVQPPPAEAEPGRFEPPTVSAAAAAKLSPLDAKDLAGLKPHVGTVRAVRGTVSAAFVPRGGSVVVLNFDRNYRSAMTAPVFQDHFGKWPGGKSTVERAYRGKTVLVRGLVTEYRGAPQIKIAHPGQIRVIE